MSEPNRPTARVVEWINARTNPPQPGSRVLALNHGGVLVPTEVSRDFLLYYDAWAAYPKVPADVKAIQLARFNTEKT